MKHLGTYYKIMTGKQTTLRLSKLSLLLKISQPLLILQQIFTNLVNCLLKEIVFYPHLSYLLLIAVFSIYSFG